MQFRTATARNTARLILTAALVSFCIAGAAQEGGGYTSAYKVASECQFSIFFDDLSNRLKLVNEDMEVVITPGLDVASMDSENVEMESRAALKKGEVQIPESFVAMLKKRLEEKRARRRKKEKSARGKTLRKVVLDPGHGGKFPGACAHGLQEKEINLWVAHRVRDLLLEEGIEVIMTRVSDAELSQDLSTDLDLRCEVANSKKADIFVSIHANASTNPAATGFEVYIVRPREDIEQRSGKAAREAPVAGDELEGEVKSESAIDKIVWRTLLKEYHTQGSSLARKILEGLDAQIEDDNRGLKEAGFRVVKWTRCPAVLVEMGYMSHRGTARKLADKGYRRAIARGIAQGILEFKKEYDSTCGFTKSNGGESGE